MGTFKSDLSGNIFDDSEMIYGKDISKPVLKLICDENKDFSAQSCLANSELNLYRDQYLVNTLTEELSKNRKIDSAVLQKLKDPQFLKDSVMVDSANKDLTFGQRLADKVADFGGSWKFLCIFIGIIIIWIVANVLFLTTKAFDPYPFVFLNLVLSCVAALQAPVIMMSQNRQEEKDRERANQDFVVNLKAELEVRLLHEKIDHLMQRQQKDLLDMQNKQLELLKKLEKYLRSEKN